MSLKLSAAGSAEHQLNFHLVFTVPHELNPWH